MLFSKSCIAFSSVTSALSKISRSDGSNKSTDCNDCFHSALSCPFNNTSIGISSIVLTLSPPIYRITCLIAFFAVSRFSSMSKTFIFSSIFPPIFLSQTHVISHKAIISVVQLYQKHIPISTIFINFISSTQFFHRFFILFSLTFHIFLLFIFVLLLFFPSSLRDQATNSACFFGRQ